MKKISAPSMELMGAVHSVFIAVCAMFAFATLMPDNARAQDPNLQLYLLMGQSNMEGMAGAEAQDRVQNSRVKVLAYTNCSSLGREYNKWYTAAPPLHGCGAGVGPGDYFAKAMADSFPKATIGLIPTAIAGVDIDYFRKGVVSRRRNEFSIPPDNKRTGAYDMVIEKAKEAQKAGVIRGILFHQGESDAGDQAWVGKVKGMVADLRKDLNLGDSVPFLAGELLYGGCCVKHNPIINQLPGAIPNAFVISAKDLPGQDQAHFNVVGQRTLGRRFAARMAPLIRARMATGVRGAAADAGKLPAGGSGIEVRHGGASAGITVACASACSGFELMGLDGKKVASAAGAVWSIPDGLVPRGLYFLRAKGITGNAGSAGAAGDGKAVTVYLGD